MIWRPTRECFVLRLVRDGLELATRLEKPEATMVCGCYWPLCAHAAEQLMWLNARRLFEFMRTIASCLLSSMRC